MSLLRSLRPILRPLTRTHHPFSARHFSTSPSQANIARMTLIGRLAAAPESQQTSTGSTMYKYAIGTNYGPRENRQTSWFNITAFVNEGSTDYVARQMQELEKGSLLHVEADGRMVSLPASGGEERGRKALNLVQRSVQLLAKPFASANADAASQAGHVEGADGAYAESG